MDAKDMRSALINKPPKKTAVRSLGSNSSTSSTSTTRSSKTLGWFLENELFDKSNKAEDAIDAQIQKMNGERKQKRVKKISKKEYVPGTAMSESSEEGYEEKRLNSLIADLVQQQKKHHLQHQYSVPPQKGAQEDFWYYDVSSDGYYYEQNGAKGWRRRMPSSALKKVKEQENAMVNATTPSVSNSKPAPPPPAPSAQMMNDAAMAAQAAATQAYFQHALMLQQQMRQPPQPPQQSQQPTMRYYDPNSDGFYYEMASVDGWKRRQPNKPVTASMPHGVTRPFNPLKTTHETNATNSPVGPNPMSYGATLARGQMPRNCVFDEGSASSSVCGDNAFADLLGPYDAVMPSISRPASLGLDAKDTRMNPNFNADRFISDLKFVEPNYARMFMPKTPDAKAVFNQTTGAAAEDERMEHLIKGIEKIWQSPTPLTGVNS